jgi:uroporphyrin-3 C-methyltransferase
VNIEISEIDAAPPDTERGSVSEPPAGPTRGGRALALLALLIALAALAGTAWLWWQGQTSGRTEAEQVAARVGRVDGAVTDLARQVGDLDASLQSLAANAGSRRIDELEGLASRQNEQVAQLQAALQEQQALSRSLQAALEGLHGRLLASEAGLSQLSARELDARGELDLAEVDYLLRLASERLQLFADVAGAEQALALADAHLAALDNPAHLGVRRAIADARSDLAGVDLPDEFAIASELDALQGELPTLPFRQARGGPEPVTEPEGGGWWEKLKSTLSSLVTVRRSAEEEGERVTLQDQDYVRQRAWLQLEVARLALMRREQAAYRDALGRVRQSVGGWLDSTDPAVRDFNTRLQALMAIELVAEWPDISEPWSALRLLSPSRPAMPAPGATDAESDDPAPPARASQPSVGDGEANGAL